MILHDLYDLHDLYYLYYLNALYDLSVLYDVGVLTCAQVMGLTVVNVGGLDIIDGNHKMTLAIMWQLMRRHTLNLLQVQSVLKYSSECLPSGFKTPVMDRSLLLLLLLLFAVCCLFVVSCFVYRTHMHHLPGTHTYVQYTHSVYRQTKKMTRMPARPPARPPPTAPRVVSRKLFAICFDRNEMKNASWMRCRACRRRARG